MKCVSFLAKFVSYLFHFLPNFFHSYPVNNFITYLALFHSQPGINFILCLVLFHSYPVSDFIACLTLFLSYLAINFIVYLRSISLFPWRYFIIISLFPWAIFHYYFIASLRTISFLFCSICLAFDQIKSQYNCLNLHAYCIINLYYGLKSKQI